MWRVKSRFMRVLAAGGLTTVVALGAPVAARATIAFVRGLEKPSVWSAANNGSGQRRLSLGTSPHISPDGTTIAFMSFTGSGPATPRLMLIGADGGTPRLLASGWRAPYVFAFSPDSGMIATVLGPEVGKEHLVLIDVESGSQRTIATGYFGGVSFSPNGESLVYSVSPSERYPSNSDIYSATVAGGSPVALTHNHHSLTPLWGPSGKIVFVEQLDAKHRLYGPKNELFTMNPSGGGVRQLTHTVVPALLQGLTPTQFSANGSRLLAEFGGQDTSYAVTVSPATGAQRPVGMAKGFVATALSANGRSILGFTGFLGSGPHNICIAAYAGGPLERLIRNGYEPSWNG
jgi:Tol biopolymer transport system component